VLRLVIGDDPNPNNWKLSRVVGDIGPVTSGISRLQDRKNHKLWLFFGEGRYFYNQDDMPSSRRLFGIKEPCYNPSNDNSDDIVDPTCTTTVPDGSNLASQTNYASPTSMDGMDGWTISMDGEDTSNSLGAERLVTDPVAMTNGAVFYTSFKPTSDMCAFGGNSYLWAVKYDTGLQAPNDSLKGKALVQVSTGEFKEIDLQEIKSVIDSTTKGGRRLATPMTGKPPSDPPPILSKSNLKPVKRIMHIQER
jgi:type IV pilus assembly protein PilY1